MPANKPPFDGEWVRLNQLCMKGRSALRQKDLIDDGPYAVYGASGIIGSMSTFQNGARYVAVVKDGAGVGRANLCSARTSVLGTMQALIPTEMVLPEYLLHLIRAMRLGDGFSGSTIPHIYFKDYGQRLVRYVSMADQERIVGMLGSIEDQIDILHQQNERFDTLVKSRFVEMFGDGQWKRTALSEVADIQGGLTKSGKRDLLPLKLPYLRVANVLRGTLYLDEVLEIGLTAAECEKNLLVEGDLLFVEGNGSADQIGRCAVWDGSIAPCVHQNHLIRVRFDERVLPVYALAYFNAHDGREQIVARAVNTSGLFTLSTGKVKALQMPLPPLPLQQKFADFVNNVDKSRFNLLKAYGSIIVLFRVLFP